MRGIVFANLKKKPLLGAGLSVLVVATITTSVYATQQADANQSSSNILMPVETDIHIDMMAGDWLVEPDNLANLTEMTSNAPSSGQQGVTDSNVNVRVNGMSIDTPENGTVYKEITSEDGSTRINFRSNSNTSSGESQSRSSVKFNVDSSVEMRSETRE